MRQRSSEIEGLLTSMNPKVGGGRTGLQIGLIISHSYWYHTTCDNDIDAGEARTWLDSGQVLAVPLRLGHWRGGLVGGLWPTLVESRSNSCFGQ